MTKKITLTSDKYTKPKQNAFDKSEMFSLKLATDNRETIKPIGISRADSKSPKIILRKKV